jgi:branched-chain amino acid transport system substrate-binding protein
MKKSLLFFPLVIFSLILGTWISAFAAEPAECSEIGGCAVIKPGETIKLGVAGPMTGEYAMYGSDMADSARVAVETMEPLEGFKFELVAEDTQGAPESAVAVASKWAADPTFVAVVGHTFSGETAASTPIYEKARIPMLSPSATGALLTSDNTVFNRVVFQDATQGKYAAEFIVNTLGYKNIAILHDGMDYGKGIADIVRDTLKEKGIEPVAYESITPGEADYSAVLTSIASKKPEIIYYGGYTAEIAVIVNQLPQVGLAGIPIFSDDGAFGVEFIEKTGKNAEGVYGTSSIPPASAEKDAFDAKYFEMYGRIAGSKSSHAWFAFDAANVLSSVVRKVAILGDDGNLYVPREAMVKGVRNVSGYKGITGEITCDEKGECNASGPTFYIVENGAWKVASQ